MKTLYILGNGFDIAHGLKTRYSDFYNYLSENKETQKFLYNMINAYGAYGDEWWNTFEESLGDGSWFEMEFENMAESVINNMITDDGDEMPDIESTLETHWEAYYKFMENLNNHVLQWISDSIDLSIVKPKVKKLKSSDDYFINFNYTMVLEEIYKISERNVFHVHGSVAERNTIMGHGNIEAIRQYKKREDSAMRRLDKNTATVNEAIASFYEATIKDTEWIINISEYFWRKLCSVEKVKVYGHSLGSVDIPYLRKILLSIAPNAEWYIYNFSMTEKEIREKFRLLDVKQERVHVLPYEEFFG